MRTGRCGRDESRGGRESEASGVVPAALRVIRAGRRVPLRWTLSVVGLAGLGGLSVTTTAFVIARHAFAEMWRAGREAHQQGDSYVPDTGLLLRLIAAGAPVLLAISWLGCAALQTAHARAATGKAEPTRWLRLGHVVAVYPLRCVIVCVVPAATFWLGVHLRPDAGRRTLLLDVLTGPAGLVALVLRLGLTFSPTAAASGAGPLAALRRSWRLVWRPGAWWRTLAVSVSAGILTVGTFVLLFHAAGPLRRVIRPAVMAFGTDNPYVAYAAGLLAPVAAALLLTALLTLPVLHTTFAVLYERLRQTPVARETPGPTARGS
ncbi:hypothetical protein J7I94_23890 [Streptomyces sp. ISL-12]|uniref:hypothetical protein n=1 Tax=Streptomyces sp. ISL-12 TaxID=2819177 RepID=UPI001BE596C3|nr:hypothetical protein [Streptomyces sp. ISL-12]MBT2413566.1 hypothetical protein [Streptomyces sp. ISL-12]